MKLSILFRNTRKRCLTLRTVNEEHIREVRCRHSEICPCSLRLLVCKRDAISALDINLAETTSDGVEACGQDDDVELVLLAVLHLDTSLSESLNGVFFERNDINVVLVVDLVVALFEGWSLGSEGVVLVFERRGKNVSLLWVVDSCSSFVGPEFICSVVDLCEVNIVVIIPSEE